MLVSNQAGKGAWRANSGEAPRKTVNKQRGQAVTTWDIQNEKWEEDATAGDWLLQDRVGKACTQRETMSLSATF